MPIEDILGSGHNKWIMVKKKNEVGRSISTMLYNPKSGKQNSAIGTNHKLTCAFGNSKR